MWCAPVLPLYVPPLVTPRTDDS